MEIQMLKQPTDSYQVIVPIFEGPMDLLLQLIEHAELEITSISLAMVTDQYLDHIHQIEQVAADEISGFLVIAAKLIQIKSEALLPRPSLVASESDDPGLSLIQQLQLYRKFKQISIWLQDREINGLRSYLRYAPLPKVDDRLDASSLTLEDLKNAAEEVLQSVQDKKSLNTVIKAPKITIREKISLITSILKKGGKVSFGRIVGQSPSKLEVVVTFLALLELIKRFHVSVHQEDLFSDIQVEQTSEMSDAEDFEIEFGE
jgi:segregation and condensation protein A